MGKLQFEFGPGTATGYLEDELAVRKQTGAIMLRDVISGFVASWRRYLMDVPRALSCCGPSGLQVLSHEEAAQAMGISGEQLAGLTVLARKELPPAEAYSLMKTIDLPWLTDPPLFILEPVDTFGEESFYDPVDVTRFAAECIDPLIARAMENVDPNVTDSSV